MTPVVRIQFSNFGEYRVNPSLTLLPVSDGSIFSICLVHIHYKLICSYLCSTEQNKISLKNNNEWFIFMIEVDLCQSEKRFFLGLAGCSRVSSLVCSYSRCYLQWRSSMLECLWPARGERSFFSAGRLPSVCGRLLERARKNSSLEEDAINALCPLIGQCVAESLGGGIVSQEKIDLWLLRI